MKEKKHDVETHTDANSEGECINGSREQDGLYGNEIEASEETYSGACTNTINSEPGHS